MAKHPCKLCSKNGEATCVAKFCAKCCAGRPRDAKACSTASHVRLRAEFLAAAKNDDAVITAAAVPKARSAATAPATSSGGGHSTDAAPVSGGTPASALVIADATLSAAARQAACLESWTSLSEKYLPPYDCPCGKLFAMHSQVGPVAPVSTRGSLPTATSAAAAAEAEAPGQCPETILSIVANTPPPHICSCGMPTADHPQGGKKRPREADGPDRGDSKLEQLLGCLQSGFSALADRPALVPPEPKELITSDNMDPHLTSMHPNRLVSAAAWHPFLSAIKGESDADLKAQARIDRSIAADSSASAPIRKASTDFADGAFKSCFFASKLPCARLRTIGGAIATATALVRANTVVVPLADFVKDAPAGVTVPAQRALNDTLVTLFLERGQAWLHETFKTLEGKAARHAVQYVISDPKNPAKRMSLVWTSRYARVLLESYDMFVRSLPVTFSIPDLHDLLCAVVVLPMRDEPSTFDLTPFLVQVGVLALADEVPDASKDVRDTLLAVLASLSDTLATFRSKFVMVRSNESEWARLCLSAPPVAGSGPSRGAAPAAGGAASAPSRAPGPGPRGPAGRGTGPAPGGPGPGALNLGRGGGPPSGARPSPQMPPGGPPLTRHPASTHHGGSGATAPSYTSCVNCRRPAPPGVSSQNAVCAPCRNQLPHFQGSSLPRQGGRGGGGLPVPQGGHGGGYSASSYAPTYAPAPQLSHQGASFSYPPMTPYPAHAPPSSHAPTFGQQQPHGVGGSHNQGGGSYGGSRGAGTWG